MPKANDLQFAVVREDPALEERLLRESSGRRVFLIASGGCTALHLATRLPAVVVTALDSNPAQIRHVRTKIDALSRRAGLDEWQALSQSGNFEALFRGLRRILEEMVAAPPEWEAVLTDASLSVEPLIGHKYWAVAFDLFFHDAMLLAMFGPHAVQHAEPGSYPRYFQRVFEAGLQRPDRARNYFLHHVLLGRYLTQALPAFLEDPPDRVGIRFLESTVEQAPHFSGYDVISLSNLFDWMDSPGIERVTRRLIDETRPGTAVLVRHLNNEVDLRGQLPGFRFDSGLANELLAADRSLFYNRVSIAVKEA